MQTEFVVELGESLYEVERPWGVLPPGLELAYVSTIAVDAEGCVYVCQCTDPPVVVLDPSGEYLRSWGSDVIADSHGIFAAADGRVLVVDRDAHQVLVFDSEGTLLQEIGERHRPRLQAPFNHPTGVAVAPGRDILVADGYANARIHGFSAEGEWLASWGTPGRGPGEFMTPHAVAIDGQNRILVADRDNDRVQVFGADGGFLEAWNDFFRPMDLFVSGGLVYVSDQMPRLSMLGLDGELLGRCRPVPYMPHGICGHSMGTIYVAESAPTDQLTRLARAG